jgi:hypothetical protein
MWHTRERREDVQGFSSGSPKEKDHSEDQGVDGRTGLEWILRRLVGGSGLSWLRIGTVGGLL